MSGSAAFSGRHYTLERDNRELQLRRNEHFGIADYTLERDNRELQPADSCIVCSCHYTLERDNRELQLTAKPLWLRPLLYP